MDPITGNPYNVNALDYVTPLGVGNGTARAACSLVRLAVDQMLYRDIDLTGATGRTCHHVQGAHPHVRPGRNGGGHRPAVR